MITLALSKGRIFDETLPLLRAAGIEVLEDADIDPGEVPDARAIAALQAALARIDQEGVTEASANVSAWATANC